MENVELVTVLSEIRDELRRSNDALEIEALSGSRTPMHIQLVESLRDKIFASAVHRGGSSGQVLVPTVPTAASFSPLVATFEQHPLSGPGPSMRGVLAMMVVAQSADTAVQVATKWIASVGRKPNISKMDDKASRNHYTKTIRENPDAFRGLANPETVVVIAGDFEAAPGSWMPAFDVIAVVNTNDTYSLFKGQRGQ